MPQVRNRFSARVRVVAEPGEEPGAKQSMKDEVNINNIMARYIRTGTLTHVRAGSPQYGFAPDMSFKDALNFMNEAQAEFERLPAKIRARFSNDPAEFVDFCSNKENLEELRKLGLAKPAEKPQEKKPGDPAPAQ